MTYSQWVGFIAVHMSLVLVAGCSTQTEPPSPTPTSIPPTATAVPSPTATPSPIPPTVTPPPTSTPTAGQTRVDAFGIEQVWVPPGTFLMGLTAVEAEAIIAQNPPSWVLAELPSEQPQHEVTLTTGYWLDKYEVTNAAFQQFVAAGGYEQQSYWSEAGWAWLERQRNLQTCATTSAQRKPDEPCVHVTWYEAEAYARWRNGRLPTEAEWEYAARGPEALMYPWGNTFDHQKANVTPSNSLKPVGSYPTGASWVGALDMAGNAMEWVQDWLGATYYAENVSIDPQGPETGRVKVEKGGWWGSNPFVARTTYRHFEDPPSYGDEHIGFRIVSP